jgi:hypothetical protein
MPSFATLGPASVRRWIWLPAAVCLAVGAVLVEGAGPARVLRRRARVHHQVHGHREPGQQRRQLAAGHRNRPDLSRVPHQRRV